MTANHKFTRSAAELARLIREEVYTSQEIVEHYIGRIKKVNPLLNAVISDRFNEAVDEAIAADRLVRETPRDERESKLPALLGVPCTVKECFAMKGMPHTSGLLARRLVKATEDSPVIQQIRKSGAIILGQTNVSECCMWMETMCPVYGQCNNPYDLTRTVGGSSGGEGCIVGAGASPFGLGSDVGGSIRMPAFFNGVFGHKSSGGLFVSNEMQYPVGNVGGLLTTGPLCRHAEDLYVLMKLWSRESHRGLLGDPNKVNLKNLRVLCVEPKMLWPLFSHVSDELLDAQRCAAKRLEKLGAKVEYNYDWGVSLLKAVLLWGARMEPTKDSPSFAEHLLFENAYAPSVRARRNILQRIGLAFYFLFHLIICPLGVSPYTFPAIMLALIEIGPQLMPDSMKEQPKKDVRDMQEMMEKILNDEEKGPAVILFPPYTSVAPPHNIPKARPVDWACTAVWNVLELPVTQVPLGLSKSSGVPLGVQVIGAHGHDHETIAIAQILEKEFGGWTESPILEVI